MIQVTKRLILEEQDAFISGRGCVHKILKLKQMSQTMRDTKNN